MRENTWNIVSESIRREYGFSGRIDRRSFTVNYLGSLHIIQKMQWSHRLNEFRNEFHCMNFSKERNLLCTGNENKHIDVYDWKNKKLKLSLKTKHSKQLCGVKFLNTGGSGMDLISADKSGQVRHTLIAPSGHHVSNRIFFKGYISHRLITVPGSPLEFIAGGSSGVLYQIDLRAENRFSTPNSIITKEEGHPYSIVGMDHHPFSPEICVCGYDKIVRTFDKRNLKEPVKKLYPNSSNIGNTLYEDHVIHCSYNYDGSEILAHYYQKGAYLFDNQCYNTGEFLQFYDSVDKGLLKFYGSTSEYMAYYDGEKIEFRDKKTNIVVWSVFRDTAEFIHASLLELHPQLPAIATSCVCRDLDIFDTTGLESSKYSH